MRRANEDIRAAIIRARLKQWQVADKVGYSDNRFSVLMRKPLPQELKDSVFSAIRDLAAEEQLEGVAQ
ncbi:MAG: hypothetical protein ABSC17_09865 [Thermacetogeniaceae bacterium]